MTTIVISPHLDDAVLSLGQTIAAMTDEVEVITVFAGRPAEGVLTEYDKARGFSSSREAVSARGTEDDHALELLGVHTITRLPHLDRQYRLGADPLVYDELVRTFWPMFDGPLFVPLGIGHPDHRLVARAALEACPPNRGMYVYEELPYRVLNPEEAADQLALLDENEDFDIQDLPAPLAQGERSVKESAIACYASQFPNGADDPCLLVPERAWLIARRR